MNSYLSMNLQELQSEKKKLLSEYDVYKNMHLSLDMSRGKPGNEQLGLSIGMLDAISDEKSVITKEGIDCRNYGFLEGLPAMRELFGKMLGVSPSLVFVGGNSSLNMMFDTISCIMSAGIGGCKPWHEQGNIKFLCPVPGYDRHFGITEYFGIEMINVPMKSTGPDMDMVEELVSKDEKIKGIWCVPKYSNPQGITYSDETVRRFANLKPKAKDFRIIWDNAYCIHDITDTPDELLNLMDECQKAGNEDLPLMFCSTSKITFPGSGVSAMAASPANMEVFKQRYKYQTIGFDKLNMQRHLLFFKDYNGMLEHMRRHKAVIKPRFDVVTQKLADKLEGLDVAAWIKPNGGYFVSVDVLEGCAKRVVELCKNVGVVLTPAGATYPNGSDPFDSNIRLAPTYPMISELSLAMDVFCASTKLAAIEKLLSKN